MPNKFDNCKIGLALSGGGAKGIAHLGVLKALEDREIHIDILSGVSAGSIMGALYADRHTPEEICRFIKKSNLFTMVSFGMPKNGGFGSIDTFKHYLGKMLQSKTFEELRYPFFVNATELNAGRNVYFNSGALLDKIIASSSVPIMFQPTIIDGKSYVDGGFFCNMPASILRKNGCDLVIGVHVNPISYVDSVDGLKSVSERVFHLAVNGNTIEEKKACDIVIEIEKAKNYGMFDAYKADELFEIGYEAAIETLDKFDWDEYMTHRRINRFNAIAKTE